MLFSWWFPVIPLTNPLRFWVWSSREMVPVRTFFWEDLVHQGGLIGVSHHDFWDPFSCFDLWWIWWFIWFNPPVFLGESPGFSTFSLTTALASSSRAHRETRRPGQELGADSAMGVWMIIAKRLHIETTNKWSTITWKFWGSPNGKFSICNSTRLRISAAKKTIRKNHHKPQSTPKKRQNCEWKIAPTRWLDLQYECGSTPNYQDGRMDMEASIVMREPQNGWFIIMEHLLSQWMI